MKFAASLKDTAFSCPRGKRRVSSAPSRPREVLVNVPASRFWPVETSYTCTDWAVDRFGSTTNAPSIRQARPATAALPQAKAADAPVTVNAWVPTLPLLLVAVMFAEPAATGVTRPLWSTVAAAVFELAHVSVPQPTLLPAALLHATDNCTAAEPAWAEFA